MNILYEGKTFIVLEKPVNMPCQPDKTGDADMVTLVCSQTGSHYAAVINRLDRVVGGAALFALNPQAAAALSDSKSRILKEYLAVATGKPKAPSGTLTNYLLKNERTNLSKIVTAKTPSAKKAVLEYTLLGSVSHEAYGELSLLRVKLETGRHHQIRAQLSGINLPLWGDMKYNPRFDKAGKLYKAALAEGIELSPALWSQRIAFNDPKTRERIDVICLPKAFPFSLFPLE